MPQKLQLFLFFFMKSIFSLLISTLNVIYRILNDTNKARVKNLFRKIFIKIRYILEQGTKILQIHEEKN